MSTISGIGAASAMSMHRPPRLTTENASDVAQQLFDRLDTSGQGYLTEADLETALAGASTETSDAPADVDVLFSKLDVDGDGKVTTDEFTRSLTALAEELQTQAARSRMSGGAGGPEGMPPPADDAGFTKEELTAQIEKSGSTGDARSQLLSSIVENFEAADTNQDGRVSFAEARAYQQSGASTQDAASFPPAGEASTASAGDEKLVMRQILRLMQAYGIPPESTTSGASSTVAVTA